ncbi:MAG: AzlD domain-containing protein [Spirochaetes bacterium]|nr:AzlD domain-containing protein [Spirochaetota bacterium]
MSKITWIIIGMTAATYLVRLTPFLLLRKIKINDRLKKFLNYVPYVVIGALIFPSVFYSVPGSKLAILGAMVFTIIFSWFCRQLIWPVLVSVIIVLGINYML